MDFGTIRAVALDFDGTLIDGDHSIRPAAVEAIRRAAAAGLVIATASGRSLRQQLEILGANGLGAGAGVPQALTVDERTVWLLRDGEYRPLRAWNDRMESVWRELQPRAEAVAAEAEAWWRRHGVAVRRSLSPEQVSARGMLGLAFVGEAEALGQRDWLTRLVAERCPELLVSQNWHLIHLLPRAAGKGLALVALAAELGLSPAQVLPVGDRHNDIPMLDGTRGLGSAAVGNAVSEIKRLVRRVGGYVAHGELGDGVAEIIERVLAAR